MLLDGSSNVNRLVARPAILALGHGEFTLWLHESAAGSSIEPMDIRLERSFEESRNLIFSGSFLILIVILLLIKDYD